MEKGESPYAGELRLTFNIYSKQRRNAGNKVTMRSFSHHAPVPAHTGLEKDSDVSKVCYPRCTDNRLGSLKVHTDLLLRKLQAWDVTTHMTCPVRNL